MQLQALPVVVFVGFLLGTNLIASRFLLNQFEPLTYVGLRLAVASAAFLSLYLFSRRRRWPRDPRLWGHAVIIGSMGTALPLTAIVTALQYQSSGITAILVTLSPALTVLLAHFFFPDEALTRLKGLGLILALSGALLLVLRGETGLPDVSQASPIGYALTFVALLCITGVTIYMRKFMSSYSSFSVSSIQIFVATLVVLPLGLFLAETDWQNVTWSGIVVVSYTGLAGTFGAFMLYFYSVKQFGAGRASMADYVAPIIATIGGVLLLGEQITLGILVGIVMIAVGIMMINYQERVARTEPV